MKKNNDKKEAPCPSCKGEGAIFINLPRDKWDYAKYGNFILCDDCEATGIDSGIT